MTTTDVTDDADVVVECGLDAPAEKVWRALSVPEFAADWLGATHATDPARNTAAERTFEIVDTQPFTRLTYRWRDATEMTPTESFVTVEIAPRGPERTWFRLTHKPPEMRLMAANGNVPMALTA